MFLLCISLAPLESVGSFVAGHEKCIFFAREVTLCGNVYSNGVIPMILLPFRVFARRCCVSMVEVMEPLCIFLEELMAEVYRGSKRVACNRVIKEGAWMENRARALRGAQDLAARIAVPLCHPRPGWVSLVFPNASNLHWACFSGVSMFELRSGASL